MTKNPRRASAWTSREIEESPDQYRVAQRAEREDRRAAQERTREERDQERFIAAFEDSGGTRSGAREAFRANRNRQAAEAAQQADEAAKRHMCSETLRVV